MENSSVHTWVREKSDLKDHHWCTNSGSKNNGSFQKLVIDGFIFPKMRKYFVQYKNMSMIGTLRCSWTLQESEQTAVHMDTKQHELCPPNRCTMVVVMVWQLNWVLGGECVWGSTMVSTTWGPHAPLWFGCWEFEARLPPWPMMATRSWKQYVVMITCTFLKNVFRIFKFF